MISAEMAETIRACAREFDEKIICTLSVASCSSFSFPVTIYDVLEQKVAQISKMVWLGL